jgi:hypothetical protein
MPRSAIALALTFALGSLGAHALTLVLQTDAELVQESERVVLGTVTATRVQWMDPDGDGERNLYTVATFRLEQILKGPGQAGDDVSFHVFGGTLDGRTQSVQGLPLPQQGERLVLCLRPNAASCKLTPVAGAVQGRWTVRTDDDGHAFARRTMSDAAFVSRSQDGTLVQAIRPAEGEEPLADLLARLQSEVR